MKFRYLLTLPLVLFLCLLCLPSSSIAYDPDKELKIWFLSDIQPRNDKERKDFERAVTDVNKNVKDIDIAVVAGDIVNTTTEESFDWYIDTKNKSYINKWYEIAGNHDLKPDEGVLYKKKLNNQLYYTVSKNNLLMIFMSDEKRSSASDISDETFNWWKELVINNQDKIIFVITHAPLKGSGITFSSFNRRNIIESNRFTKILNSNRVDLWLSGHLHIPHSIVSNFTSNKKFKNTKFLNISSIRRELMGFKDSESFIIILNCGSSMVEIKSRNHTRSSYNKNQVYNYKLNKKYLC